MGSFELYRPFFVLDPAQPVVASLLGEALPEGSASRPVGGSVVAGAAPNSVSMLLTVALGHRGPVTCDGRDGIVVVLVVDEEMASALGE